MCVRAHARERSHSSRTALLNTIRGFSLMGLFSLCCQPACGALCLWGSSGRQVFRVGSGFQPERLGGWGWGRDQLLIRTETEAALRDFGHGPRDSDSAHTHPRGPDPRPGMKTARGTGVQGCRDRHRKQRGFASTVLPFTFLCLISRFSASLPPRVDPNQTFISEATCQGN